MLSEHCFTQLIYLRWTISFSFLGRNWIVRPSIVPMVVLASFLVYAHSLVLYNSSLTALRKLMVNLTYLSTHCLTTSLLLGYVLDRDDYRAIFKRIRDIGHSMNSKLEQQSDWELLLLVCSSFLMISSIVIFIRVQSKTDVILFLLVPIEIEVMCLVVTKYLIAKRLRYIRSSEEYLRRIEDTISHTRQLLQCNSKLNKSFELLGTAIAIFTFNIVQCICYTMFAIHGAGIKMPEAMENRLIEMTVGFANIIVIIILFAWSSTLIADEVSSYN